MSTKGMKLRNADKKGEKGEGDKSKGTKEGCSMKVTER